MDRGQLAAFALVFVLLGSLAYYNYYSSEALTGQNAEMKLEIARLDANITQLTAQLAQNQANQAEQGEAVQAILKVDADQLANLSEQLSGVQAGNITALRQVSAEVAAISSSVASLKQSFSCVLPSMLLRTQGTALASFVDGPDNNTYLRLTETGPNSLVESSIGTEAFNASVSGATAEWYAMSNPEASLPGHIFWPMVLENSPGGTNAIEFEDSGGVQEVAVDENGSRTVHGVNWDPSVPNLFEVVVTVPGQQVEFYINGNLVATISASVPSSQFLIFGAEVKGGATTDAGIATVDTYGGMLGNC
jgi:hypothetical protein